MKKYISILLAAVMAASTVSFSALAEEASETASKFYPQNGAYYNDFSEGDIYSGLVVGSASNKYNVNFATSPIAERYFETNPPRSELADGKLKMTTAVDSNGFTNDNNKNVRESNVTYVKFDKEFDVSENVTKNLIVSYDVAVTDFNFDRTENENDPKSIQRVQFGGALFGYDETAKKASNIVFGGAGVLPTGNNGQIGMAFQYPSCDENKMADKAGLLISLGNSTGIQSVAGTGLGGQGIFNRPMGNVFHVEYEITPATVTGEGEDAVTTPARIAKVTMSDDEYTATYISANCANADSKKAFNLTDTSIAGIDFIGFQGISYEFDNVKAYYKNTATPSATATNNGSEITLKDKLKIKLNCWIDESTADGIIVKCGDDVINTADVKITRSTTTYETNVEVTVPDMRYGQTYKVVIPDTLLSENETAFEETTLSWTTEPLPNINPTLTVSYGAESVTELSMLAGKYATCKVSATTEKNVSALLVVGLYDSEDKLVSYGAEYAAFENGKNEEMTVSFPVPSNTEGMSIKAFACESLEKASVKLGSVAELN